MRKSTYLSAAIATVACLLVFLWQNQRISALEARSKKLQSETTSLGRQGESAPEKNPAPVDEQESTSADTITAAELRALWPEGIDINDFAAVANVMPKLTEAVADCTSAQLLEIAGTLVEENHRRSDRLITKLLLIIVGEEDPAGALSFWDEHHQSIDQQQELVRSALLAKLAKTDLPLAIEKIDRAALHANDLRRCRIAVSQELLKSDISAGLGILAQGTYCDPCTILGGLAHGFYNSGNAFRIAAREPGVAEKLWSRVNQMDNGSERQILTEGMLEFEAVERGSKGVSEAFAKIENLEQNEHERLLFNTSLNTRYADPAGTIELFRKHSTTDKFRNDKVADIFKSWLKKKPREAGAWLREDAPSANRDQLIAKLAAQLSTSAPEEAIDWAQEISDKTLRKRTIRKLKKL